MKPGIILLFLTAAFFSACKYDNPNGTNSYSSRHAADTIGRTPLKTDSVTGSYRSDSVRKKDADSMRAK